MSTTTEQFERDSEEAEDENLIDDSLKNRSGRLHQCTLQMLLASQILEPGPFMSIEYLGQKFIGDLLPDGKIKSTESDCIYLTPSAWALACKKLISDKKSGCGWASVKYKGKKLDAYKTLWVKKCNQQRDTSHRDSSPTEDDDDSIKPILDVNKKVYPFNTVANRNIEHDLNSLVEAVPFASLGKVQPFLVVVHTQALLMIDFHSHLSLNEVVGYLGGDWDNATNSLTITKAFPCMALQQDTTPDKAAECELNIQKGMIRQNLKLVGWYHSHPTFDVQPTLRDCDNQLEYQIQLRGATDATYSPCIGFVCSPYDKKSPALDSKMIGYWVIPPTENKPMEYGRPMMMVFNPISDKNFSDGFLGEMQEVVDYYRNVKALLDLNGIFKDKITYFDALKASMTSRIPNCENKENFWTYLRDLLKIKRTVVEEASTIQPSKKDSNPIMRELIEQSNSLPPPPVEPMDAQNEDNLSQ